MTNISSRVSKSFVLYLLSTEAEVYCPSWIMFNWSWPILASFTKLLKSKEAEIKFYPRPVLAFRYCRCLRLCVSVCLSVSVCINHKFVRVITRSPIQARITKFEAQMQKTLVQVPIVLGGDRPWPSRSNLTWKSNFTSFWACLCDNFSSVKAKVTKGWSTLIFRVKFSLKFKFYPILSLSVR